MENFNTQGTENTPNPDQKGLSKKTIGIIAAIIVVVVGIAIAIGAMKKDPKDVIVNGLAQITSSKDESAFSKTIGLKELMNSTEASEANIKLTLDHVDASLQLPDAFKDSTITSKGLFDNVNQQLMGSSGVQIAGVDFGEFKIYMDQKELAFGASKLTKKVITLDHTKDLKKGVRANPYLKKTLNLTDSDYTMINDFFEMMRKALKSDTQPATVGNVFKNYKDALQTKKDVKAMLENVKKLPSESFTYQGKTINANGYEATITRDTLVKHLEKTKEYANTDETFKAEMLKINPAFYEQKNLDQWNKNLDDLIEIIKASEEDLVLKVYVDKAGNLVSVSFTKDVKLDNTKTDITFLWNLEGGNTKFENSNGYLKIKDKQSDVTVKFTKTGNTASDKFDTSFELEFLDKEKSVLKMGYDGDYLNESGAFNFKLKLNVPDSGADTSFEMTGNISDLEPGKAATFTFDNIAVKVSGTELVSLKGSYDYKPLETMAARPEGTDLNALTASQKDWTALNKEMEKSLTELMQQVLLKLYLK